MAGILLGPLPLIPGPELIFDPGREALICIPQNALGETDVVVYDLAEYGGAAVESKENNGQPESSV